MTTEYPLTPNKEMIMLKITKTNFPFKYILILCALVIWSIDFSPMPSTVWAQSAMMPTNLEQFWAQDARMQKQVVRLAVQGKGAEAANILDQIADRDLKMADNLPSPLKNRFKIYAARCRELAKSMRRQ
jgi:hypothetical protein